MNTLNNKHDRKFNNQINHLQSFIGMPMWNGRNPSLSQIREYDRRLLEKQALGFEPKKKGFFHRLSTGLKFRVLEVIGLFSRAKQKTKSIKREMAPQNQPECCG